MDLQELVDLSREYGADPDWVIAGGGNTSIKNDTTMWVKASGTFLQSISADGFVAMDRAALNAVWETEYPRERAPREERAKQDLLAARATGEEKRASVEALMHALFPAGVVFHTHPTLVNALACATDGQATAERIFGDDVLWIPVVDPGYTLARFLYDRFAEIGSPPPIVILANHGLVAHGDAAEDVRAVHERIDSAIRTILPHDALSLAMGAVGTADAAIAAGTAGPGLTDTEYVALPYLSESVSAEVFLAADSVPVLAPYLTDRAAFAPLEGSLSPDHIVYAGHRPAWAESLSPSELERAVTDYRTSQGVDPKIMAVRNHGILALGRNTAAARAAAELFINAAQITTLAESVGGVRFLPDEQVTFIREWEVEKFRTQILNQTGDTDA